jgi:hypothetical protein
MFGQFKVSYIYRYKDKGLIMSKFTRQILFMIFLLLIATANISWSATGDTSPIQTGIKNKNELIFGGVSWIDSNILAKIGGPTYDLRAMVYGNNLCYRTYFDLAGFNSFFDMGLVFAKANVQNQNTDIVYKQVNASVFGALFNLGLFERPASEMVTIGVSLPVLYREVSFKVPNVLYQIKTEKKFIPYYALNLSWQLTESFSLQQEFGGSLFSKDGTLWKVDLAWVY